MKLSLAAVAFGLATLFALPAQAVTVVNGVVHFNQADALAGNVTPGDAPGYPVTISVPGSYRLSSNLQGAANQNGITVTAAEVTLDFAGFRLIGGGTGLNGVVGNARALTVKNGTIRAFTLQGIRMTAQSLIVDSMRIADNGQNGVFEDFNVPSAVGYATISRSTLTGNSDGIFCMKFCHVQENNISDNDETGVLMNDVGGTVLGNTISSNGATGIFGNSTGVGNNTIFGHTTSIAGTFSVIHPNFCSPAC